MANYGKPEYWEDRYQKDKEQFPSLVKLFLKTVQESYQVTLKELLQQSILMRLKRRGRQERQIKKLKKKRGKKN